MGAIDPFHRIVPLWLGTSVAVDFRLVCASDRRETPSQLQDALFVWNWVGFGLAVVGGFLLFSIAATSFFNNPAFRIKLGFLVPAALLTHILVQRKTPAWSGCPKLPMTARIAGLVELLLWLSAATAAVSIPYF